MIVLAIPFGFRAIYVSTNIQFMTLLYIQIEIILDCMIIAEVVYNIAFIGTAPNTNEYHADEQERGIKDILSDDNLKRLQKEIIDVYGKNNLLNFDDDDDNNKNHSPERTHTENSKSYNGEQTKNRR